MADNENHTNRVTYLPIFTDKNPTWLKLAEAYLRANNVATDQ